MLASFVTEEQMYLAAETGYRLICEGRCDEAVAIFDGLSAIDESNGYYRFALAAAHAQAGDWSGAVRELDLLLGIEPVSQEGLVRRCTALIRLGDIDGARMDIAALEGLGAFAVARSLREFCSRIFP